MLLALFMVLILAGLLIVNSNAAKLDEERFKRRMILKIRREEGLSKSSTRK